VTEALEQFYNADVAIVDMSVRSQQAALCYHLGVRESMKQEYNIVIHSCQDALTRAGVIEPIKVSY
jgi:mitogen-activated protein kinase kinase kinase 5